MKKYLVEVVELHTDAVWVEAESEDDAKDKAMELSDCRFKCIDECEVIFEVEIEREEMNVTPENTDTIIKNMRSEGSQSRADYLELMSQRLAEAEDLLQQIYDCPVNWVESTIPKGGMNPDNPKHRGQVVGTQHISYTRLHRIAAFLHQNIEHEKGE